MKLRWLAALPGTRRLIPTALLLILAGCTQVATQPGLQLSVLPPLVSADAAHYVIQSADSNVRFLVYRVGPLAAFGHNHVIRAATINGDVYLNPQFTLSGFALKLPVSAFRVDEPAQRAAEGPDFSSQPSTAAISGTLHNMLSPELLDAEHYPVIDVRSVRIAGTPDVPVATVRITLHGTQRDIDVPIKLDSEASRLVVSGQFAIKQTDFGLTPFSILGGGLQVADAVQVHFRIAATCD